MTIWLKQGELNFRSGYKRQTRWGLSEASVFALESAGAPLVVAALAAGAPLSAMVLGLIMVALAVTLLFLHLGNPQRAWMAIRNIRHSWISRGTIVLGGFLGLGGLYVVLRFADALPADAEWPARYALLIAGVFIPLYPGLVLSASPSIPFWNSGLLPVLSFIQGAASAAIVWLALAREPDALGAPLAMIALWLVAAHAVVTALYLVAMRQRSGAAAQSVRLLITGEPFAFLLCGCGLAIALPLAVTAALALGGGMAAPALAATALARLAGDLALRHAFLKVGLFDPVI
jgi:formate-dependent nitrite reductase membrane component NrfD